MGEEELLLESTGKRRLGAGLALVVMALLVAAAIGVATVTKGAADAAKPTPTGTPEILVLTRFEGDGLQFDYPASWAHVHADFNMHYNTILEFFGTSSDLRAGRGLPTCGPGPDGIGTACGPNIGVGPGELLVTFSWSDGPPRDRPIDPADATVPLDPSASYTRVAGLPAIYRETKSGGELEMEWTLSVPAQVTPRFIIDARIVGPGEDRMRASVDELVASVRYDPPVPVLKPADGPAMAARAIAARRVNDASFGCFPTTPGQTTHAIVTQLPHFATLSKALPVSCETAIEPTEIGMWKMTLTQTWAAADDRVAGSLVTTIWLSPDGDPRIEGTGGSDVPYLRSI